MTLALRQSNTASILVNPRLVFRVSRGLPRIHEFRRTYISARPQHNRQHVWGCWFDLGNTCLAVFIQTPLIDPNLATVLHSVCFSRMPVLTRNDASPRADIPQGETPSNSGAWIVVAVVVGSGILLAVAIVAAVLPYYRRREYSRAKTHDPSLSRKEFERRRKMTAEERQREEELERRLMIRKSLAGRSLDWSVQCDNESLDMHEHRESSGLKDDWKEWEAGLQRERPESTCRHPSATVLPELPAPAKARPRSPSRSPLLGGESPSLFHDPPQAATVDT